MLDDIYFIICNNILSFFKCSLIRTIKEVSCSGPSNRNDNIILKYILMLYFFLYSSILLGFFSKSDFLMMKGFNSEFLFYSLGCLNSCL